MTLYLSRNYYEILTPHFHLILICTVTVNEILAKKYTVFQVLIMYKILIQLHQIVDRK